MTIQEEFYNRIDNDNGYDNQKLGDDLIKIAEKHHKEQLSLCSVSQQRELLADFLDSISTYDIECLSTKTIVDNYISKDNCG